MTVLFAHGSPVGAHGLLTTALQQWPWEPVTLVLLLVSVGVYVRGVRALWRRAGPGGGIARWEAAAFLVGLLSLAGALLSPLTWLSSILFAAHMTQHEILMLVSAPLLVFGKPLLAFLWAFAPARRESLGGWARARRVRQAWQASTGPLFVFLLHAAALWVWHAPMLYEAALRSSLVHALQHLMFVGTAALFWWGMVHGRYGRMGYGVGVLYVFLTALHSSILGALMAIAPGVWYSSHAQAARTWGFDALLDQQLAGLLMWVPSGVVFIVFGLALLAAWLGESERRARLGSTSAG